MAPASGVAAGQRTEVYEDPTGEEEVGCGTLSCPTALDGSTGILEAESPKEWCFAEKPDRYITQR